MASNEEIETARLALSLARAEIVQRMTIREQIVGGYVLAVVSLLGVIAGTTISTDSRILVGLVAPVATLIVAVIVAQHNLAIEHLAQMIRYEINPFLIRRSAWAPHWDWYTRHANEWSTSVEGAKTFFRTILQFVAIHLPSILSFIFACVAIAHLPSNSDHLNDGLYGAFWIGSLFCLVSALSITLWSMNQRRRAWANPVESPSNYDEQC